MKRGTIVLTKFPFTDQSSDKRRPGIVVSKNYNETNDVIVAYISSVIPQILSPTDYLITSHQTDFLNTGLKKDSVLKLDKLATINSTIISGEIGFLSIESMKEIDLRLKHALGLS